MRDYLIERLYECTKKPYQKYFKKNDPWDIDKKQLFDFPNDSLGYGLGNFLYKNHFDIQEKLEDHDVIHVLTNTGISVYEEIGMQYYLLGNGKRSLYLFMVILSGTIFYPNQIKYFFQQFKRGKQAHSFHYLDFSKMLSMPIQSIQKTFKI
ncbi:ubiquinone biosynthesis protein Coq4 [Flavobacterium sp. HSC-32F16]|uniref:ubiquinone biosynthesis protein COQ4 n=1 Tax=Flavobacterium sp. HSC-32F16 TaxID=2910964 RepID=UPI0020A5E0F6|nr:ubiquinone biosynthesis protein COQ4 [Flavobacterium sp. HSC-32F16]MCP2025724.1 ubiquinone biosynthesis protein Coq4 [Flavobacterium sp. HSC-32F16]